jgi:hypothetical protein
VDSGTVVAIVALAGVAGLGLLVWFVSGRDRRAGIASRLAAVVGAEGLGLAVWISYGGPLWSQSFLIPVFAVGAAGATACAILRLGRSRHRIRDQVSS